MDFSKVTDITIPNGVVLKITSNGVVLWEKQDTNSNILLYKNCNDLGGIIEVNTMYLKNNSIVSNTYKNGQGEIVFEKKLTEIWSNAFYNKDSLSEIIIPSSVKTIQGQAFYDCSNLVYIEIPNSVTSIGSYAFYACTKLKSIQLPNNITTISRSTFEYCLSLENVEIPNSVTTIENGVFYNCKQLSELTIPEKVTSIGGGVFMGCPNFSKLKSLNPIAPTIQSNTFEGVSNYGTLYIPKNASGYDVWIEQLRSISYYWSIEYI